MNSSIYHQAILITLIHFWTSSVFAVCGTEPLFPSVELAYSGFDAFQVDTAEPYNVDGISTYFNLTGHSWQASHEYLALDYFRDNLTTPVTNGDLHTLQLGFRNDLVVDEINNLNWEILPTLAVSSNQLKNPDGINGSSFRIDGHLVWQARLQNSVSVLAGGCATAVSGNYELIPVAGIEYNYSDWRLSIAYPKSNIVYAINPVLNIVLSWGLAGNEWQVLDKNLENRNQVQLMSKQIKAGFRFNLSSFGVVESYWIHHYDQEMEYLARNDLLVSAAMDDTTGWMLRYTHMIK